MPIMNAKRGDVAMHAFVLSMWIAGVPVTAVMEDAGMTVVPIGGTSGAERFAVTAQATLPAGHCDGISADRHGRQGRAGARACR